jgi:hypothetical protein
MGKTKRVLGCLEINYDRGVIYFHLEQQEDLEEFGQQTILHICKLGKIPKDVVFIDITKPEYCQLVRKE